MRIPCAVQLVEYFYGPDNAPERHHVTVFFTRTYRGAKRIQRLLDPLLPEAVLAELQVEIREIWHVQPCRCSRCRPVAA